MTKDQLRGPMTPLGESPRVKQREQFQTILQEGLPVAEETDCSDGTVLCSAKRVKTENSKAKERWGCVLAGEKVSAHLQSRASEASHPGHWATVGRPQPFEWEQPPTRKLSQTPTSKGMQEQSKDTLGLLRAQILFVAALPLSTYLQSTLQAGGNQERRVDGLKKKKMSPAWASKDKSTLGRWKERFQECLRVSVEVQAKLVTDMRKEGKRKEGRRREAAGDWFRWESVNPTYTKTWAWSPTLQ